MYAVVRNVLLQTNAIEIFDVAEAFGDRWGVFTNAKFYLEEMDNGLATTESLVAIHVASRVHGGDLAIRNPRPQHAPTRNTQHVRTDLFR